MPMKAKTICTQAGCGTIVNGGRCSAHAYRLSQPPKPKPAPGLGYNTAPWRRLRAQVLREEPLCMCDIHKGADDAPASTVVDHIQAHRNNPSLFWDRANLRGMAKPCHDAKTSRFDSWHRKPSNAAVNA